MNGRLVPGSQLDGVEGVAARLDPDVCRHLLVPEFLERDAERKRLRDRLNRERMLAITGLEDAPVCRHDAHAELVGIGFRELGDVCRDLALVDRQIPSVKVIDERLHFVRRGRSCHVVCRPTSNFRSSPRSSSRLWLIR